MYPEGLTPHHIRVHQILSDNISSYSPAGTVNVYDLLRQLCMVYLVHDFFVIIMYHDPIDTLTDIGIGISERGALVISGAAQV